MLVFVRSNEGNVKSSLALAFAAVIDGCSYLLQQQQDI
jgi:hypothetical protein